MGRPTLRSIALIAIIVNATACPDDNNRGRDVDTADAADLGDMGPDDSDLDLTDLDVIDLGDTDADELDSGDLDADDTDVGDMNTSDIDASDADINDADDSDASDADSGDIDNGDLDASDATETTFERMRVVAANLTSGNDQRYEAPGIRILQGLAPEIALIQEFRYADEPVFRFGGLSGFVSGTFGVGYDYYVGPGSLPNGVVSKYPIVDAGTWDDVTIGNRGFDWARIDIPGPVDLWAVSVHLKASAEYGGQRNLQATALVDFITENVPAGDYLVVGGDFNTQSRTEACIVTLSSVVETSSPWPADGNGDGDTNSARNRPYDWVLIDTDLAASELAVAIGSGSYSGGLVVDTRVFTPLSDLSPAELGDSSASQMQHMAVVRDFEMACTPRARTVCEADTVYWQDDCGNLGTFETNCDCGCDSQGIECRPCTCEADTCSDQGTCSIVDGAAHCSCVSGCIGEYCDRCGVATQRISVGSELTCVVEAAGSLACWGFSNEAQAVSPGGTGFTHVGAGWHHACALDSAGRVICWGDDSDDQATAPSGDGFVELAIGQSHSCARRDTGGIECWGANSSGQATAPTGTGYQAVAAGRVHTCAINASGRIECWGDPEDIASIPSGSDFVRITADRGRSCALDSAGAVHCWGITLPESPPSGNGFTDVAIGSGYGLVLNSDGGVVCWGSACDVVATDATGLTDLVSSEGTACAFNAAGAPQCWGYDFHGAASVPPTQGVSAMSAGYDIVCTRNATGELSCLGFEFDGRTLTPDGTGFGAFEVAVTHGCALTAATGEISCWGNDDWDQASPPTETGYQDIAVGASHSCALDSNDRIVCWGRDTNGCTTAPDEDFSAVSAGSGFTCGLRANTSITCWGSDVDGKLDAPISTGFKQIESREATSCAIRNDDSVVCWGAGTAGVSVPAGGFSQVAPGAIAYTVIDGDFESEEFSCGLRPDGSLDCWGTLGMPHLEPPEGTNFVAVSSGSHYMCALDTGGVMQCWGDLVRPPALDLP